MTDDSNKSPGIPFDGAPPAAPPLSALASTLSAPAASPAPFVDLPPPAAKPRAAPFVPETENKELGLFDKTITVLRTIWGTVADSVLKPAVIGAAIAGAAVAALALLLMHRQLFAAVTSFSVQPLMRGAGAQVFAFSIGLGALVMSLRGLADYLFAGDDFLRRSLKSFVPDDLAALMAHPVDTLKFYHAILRLSGACAFACELVFQTTAFGLIAWAVATAWPATHLFTNPEMLSPAAAILFWAERVFSLVDGPDTFGVQLSPLLADKSVWPFGVVILFFKLGVISLVIKLVQDSIALKPSDISRNWALAIERAR